MAVFDTCTQGTPNWVELSTPDQRGAAEFYGALFGWQMVENPLEDGHVYIVGNLQGDAVAGITVTSHAEITGDFNSAYTVKSTAHSERSGGQEQLTHTNSPIA